MKRHVTQGEWSLWEPKTELQFFNKLKIMFRSEQPLGIYGCPTSKYKREDEILLGISDNGEIEVLWDCSYGLIRAISDGRVWFKTFQVTHPVERADDTIYTSLERPPSLSPEMQAVMRMVKQNEIEREKQREENRKLQNSIRLQQAAVSKNIGDPSDKADKPAAKTKKAKSGKSDTSGEPFEEPEGDSGGSTISKLDAAKSSEED